MNRSLSTHPSQPQVALLNKLCRHAARIAPGAALPGSAAVIALFALSGFNLQALAATDTWTGADAGPSTDWATADNWSYSSGAGPVASGDSLVFTSANGSGSTTLTDSLTNSSFDIDGITYNTGALAYTMTGNAFALAGPITNNSISAEAINNAITLAAGSAFVVGSSDGTITLGGAVSGTNGVTLTSGALAGTLVLSDATYTGATTVNEGTLNITGGSFGSSSSAFAVNGTSGTAQTATATVSGGTLLSGTVSIGVNGNNNSALMTISGSAGATFTAVDIGAGGVNTAQGLVINTTGTVSLGTVLDSRDTNTATAGLTVQSGTVTALSVDVTAAGSSTTTNANLNISGGSLTITNATGGLKIGDINSTNTTKAGHAAYLSMTGGTLTYLGSDGLLAVATPTTGNLTQTGNVSITGGTATLTGITLNTTDSTTATSTLTVATGATLYLGSVGLVANEPTGSVVSISLGTATVGAIAPWSTSAPISLTGTTTFQAADSNGNAQSITMSAVLSGSGGLAVSGAGSVTLAAANTYTGSTAVNTGGTVVLTGSISATTATTVATGGNLEVDGLLASTAPAAVSGELSGVGTFNGAIATSGVISAGATLGSTATGTLTSTGNISLDSNSTLSFRLGLNSMSNPSADQLDLTGGGALTLDNSLLQILAGTGANLGAALDQLYVIVNGGAGLSSGLGTDSFFNAPFNGTNYVYTNPSGLVFDVFYATDAANDGANTGDIDVELVAIPEPGAWASLIGGMGILIVWQRSRRRRG
jgi:hypothetical protein